MSRVRHNPEYPVLIADLLRLHESPMLGVSALENAIANYPPDTCQLGSKPLLLLPVNSFHA